MSGVTAGLRDLLGRLQAYKVDFVRGSADYLSDRYKVADLTEANAISSQDKTASRYVATPGKLEFYEGTLHRVVIDVDVPVHVVDSSTPGHHHLYVEISPTTWELYVEWLKASAAIGLVEEGYVHASIARGHTAVRLPWVTKADDRVVPELDDAIAKAAADFNEALGIVDPF